jgi:regulatory protein
MPFSRAKRKQNLDEPALYQYAIGSLGRKMRTVAELKRLLRTRVEQSEDGESRIDTVINRLKDQKYLNDSRYATTYAEYRQANEKFGKRRVVSDLKAKGVHPDVIETAVGLAYEEVPEEQLARQFLARKRLKKPVNERESARVFRMLMRAGFSSAIIFRVLKKWDVADEVLTALEGELPEEPE